MSYHVDASPEGEYETIAYEYMFEPMDIDPLPDNQNLSDFADRYRIFKRRCHMNDPRERLRRLTAERSATIQQLHDTIQEVNAEYDRKALELRHEIDALELSEPEPEPEFSVKRERKPPKDNTIDRINAYNREHGLPLI